MAWQALTAHGKGGAPDEHATGATFRGRVQGRRYRNGTGSRIVPIYRRRPRRILGRGFLKSMEAIARGIVEGTVTAGGGHG